MSKKSALIITMHKVKNFGSALQAWALQESILKMGLDVKMIDYLYPNQYYFSHVPEAPVVHRSVLKKIRLSKLLGYIKKNYLYKHKQQTALFQRFWEKHFLLTKPYTSPDELQANPPKADFYITGSDQVWNPNTMYGDPSFFLDFGSKETPRIAYAASFGTNVIPEEYKDIYTKYLGTYNHLGIREKTGVELVKSLTGKSSSLVCDPTILLTKEDYKVLADDSTIHINRPYLLAYILDYAYNPRPAIDSIIEEVSKKLGLHIVYLLCGNTNGYKLGSTTFSGAGPNEFVSLFRNASFVVTSSFHGTVFSLIHEKPFYAVLPAEKADSRIASLLSAVGLLDRGIKANEKVFLANKEEMSIDYDKATPALNELRNCSLHYLESSLI